MKKVIVAVMISVMLMMAPGCALVENKQVQELSSITISAPILIADIENVSNELTALQTVKNIYNENELEIFENAMITFEMLKIEYSAFQTLKLVPDIGNIKVMWEAARESYASSMEVINAHRAEYTSKTIISIDVMKAHAEKTDKDMTALLDNPSIMSIGSALKILEGLVAIGLKIAVVA